MDVTKRKRRKWEMEGGGRSESDEEKSPEKSYGREEKERNISPPLFRFYYTLVSARMISHLWPHADYCSGSGNLTPGEGWPKDRVGLPETHEQTHKQWSRREDRYITFRFNRTVDKLCEVRTRIDEDDWANNRQPCSSPGHQLSSIRNISCCCALIGPRQEHMDIESSQFMVGRFRAAALSSLLLYELPMRNAKRMGCLWVGDKWSISISISSRHALDNGQGTPLCAMR